VRVTLQRGFSRLSCSSRFIVCASRIVFWRRASAYLAILRRIAASGSVRPPPALRSMLATARKKSPSFRSGLLGCCGRVRKGRHIDNAYIDPACPLAVPGC